MKKRLLFCSILALFLLSFPAFASGNTSTRLDAVCRLPDISVTIPATAEVFINPYRLPLSIESTETTAQVISSPASIENRSEVPLSVTVTVVGAVREGSNMALTSAATGGIGSKKCAFVYFEMKASDTANPSQSIWDSEYNGERHQVVRTTSKTKKNIVTLDAVDGANHFGVFRLTGDCVAVPRVGWTEDDGIDVEIAFTFTPLPRPGT